MNAESRAFWKGFRRGQGYAHIFAAPFVATLAAAKHNGWLMAIAVVMLVLGILVVRQERD